METSPRSGPSPSAPVKICKLCRKDVSQTKRIKDAHGAYYCHPCAASAKIGPVPPQKPVMASAAGPVMCPAAPSIPMDDPYAMALESDFSDAPAPRTPVVAEEPAAAPPQLPDKCPNCELPVRTKSIICLRCKRNLTLPVSPALAAARKRKPDAAEHIGNITGKLVRLGVVLFVIAFLAFSSYGIYLMFFASKGAFDSYPTTHEQLIHDFLSDIATGTDKSYEQAFFLVSFRARTVANNPNEIEKYKFLFAHIHDDFVSKYGANWINSVQILKEGEDTSLMDDQTTYTFKIKEHEYQISTQVQIAIDQTIANIASKRPTYVEDGKNRFGVIQIAQYPVDWRAKHKFSMQ